MARREVTVAGCERCPYTSAEQATAERIWAVEDRYYRLRLCARHAAAFDRELGAWTMLAEEVDNPYDTAGQRRSSPFFTAERKRETARLRELRDRAIQRAAESAAAEAAEAAAHARRAQFEAAEHPGGSAGASPAAAPPHVDADELAARRAIPGAFSWGLTTHARQRAAQRGFSIAAVLRTAAQPEHTYRQSHRGPGIALYSRGDCRVVVDTETQTIITVVDRSAAWDAEPDTAQPDTAAPATASAG